MSHNIPSATFRGLTDTRGLGNSVYYKESAGTRSRQSVEERRETSYAERIHQQWLKRIHRLLYPEREEYRESLLFQDMKGEENHVQREDNSLHEELLQLLQEIQQKKIENFRARWNFDPITETRLEGRWEWSVLPE